jgi:hypothetical protein
MTWPFRFPDIMQRELLSAVVFAARASTTPSHHTAIGVAQQSDWWGRLLLWKAIHAAMSRRASRISVEAEPVVGLTSSY